MRVRRGGGKNKRELPANVRQIAFESHNQTSHVARKGVAGEERRVTRDLFRRRWEGGRRGCRLCLGEALA